MFSMHHDVVADTCAAFQQAPIACCDWLLVHLANMLCSKYGRGRVLLITNNAAAGLDIIALCYL